MTRATHVACDQSVCFAEENFMRVDPKEPWPQPSLTFGTRLQGGMMMMMMVVVVVVVIINLKGTTTTLSSRQYTKLFHTPSK